MWCIFSLWQDLEERERIVREREALVCERDGLELKELQRSHAMARTLDWKSSGDSSPQGKSPRGQGQARKREGGKFEQLSRER